MNDTEAMDAISTRTWDDLAAKIAQMTPEQRQGRIQIVPPFCDDSVVLALQPGFCFGSIDELDLRYTRSSHDNKHHPEDFVLMVDGNGFTEDGVGLYVMGEGTDLLPVFPNDPEKDWTGPAQQILDQGRETCEA